MIFVPFPRIKNQDSFSWDSLYDKLTIKLDLDIWKKQIFNKMKKITNLRLVINERVIL